MQTIDMPDIKEFMTTHLLHVFDTMFSMKPVPLAEAVLREESERITGSAGFAGETVTGAVYLHLQASFASVLAAGLLGTMPENLSDAEVNDVVGELTNMLTGGLKSWFCDGGNPCAVSTPGIIRGHSFAVEPLPEVQRLSLEFSSGPNRLSVEVHYKFQ